MTDRKFMIEAFKKVKGKKKEVEVNPKKDKYSDKPKDDVEVTMHESNTDKYVYKLRDINDELADIIDNIIEKTEDENAVTPYCDAKRIYRILEDIRDELENRGYVSSEDSSTQAYEAVDMNRKPSSIRDALRMMKEANAKQTAGAMPSQPMTDNWSKGAKDFAAVHKTELTDIEDVLKANKKEIDASLRRSVDYRHNDNQAGDKKPVK